MKCPNCGAEIVHGHLYCDQCGMEIRMVPDFEPEIENSITETLSTVAEEIEDNKSPAKRKRKKKSQENSTLLTLVIFLAVMSAGAFAVVFLYHRYSVGYQVDQARKCAKAQEYERAVAYLEKAKELSRDDAEIVFLESNYYYQMGEMEKASAQLLKLIADDSLTYDEREKAYENVIAIWDEQGKYGEINSLLLDCGENEITSLFQHYMAMEPEFGYKAGNYDEILLLKITANTTGKIYYTLDGSNPDENSQVYKAPLILDSGEYQIAAMFVNDYGQKSEVARSWYVVNVTVPDPPEVLLYSGSYHVPTLIEVIPPQTGTVYYTTDSSDPALDSIPYTGAIEMPLGKSNFKFAVISEEGISSEVVSRSFDFALETDVTVSRAIDNVIQALIDRKVLTDEEGHSHEIKGKYVFQYDSIVKVKDLGYYYVLDEYIEDMNGIRTKTDRLYAVEVYTGTPNRLVYDENGEMGLISLS